MEINQTIVIVEKVTGKKLAEQEINQVIIVLGAAVFGPVGAVAGIGGKKTHTVTYQCTN